VKPEDYSKEWVFEQAREFAQRMMRQDGYLSLTLFAYNASGEVLAISLNDAWGGPAFMRDIAILQAKDAMRKQNARCYTILSEAWMVAVELPEVGSMEAARNKAGAPSEHPDRIEVITVVAGDRAGTMGDVWLIKRKPNGKFSHLENIERRGKDPRLPPTVDGRFADLLVDTAKAH
jgi:hypothetical protein